METLKPFIGQFIEYYYNELDNCTGGNLHIVLDDGNIGHADIRACRYDCENDNDQFGIFLCDILLLFTEDELYDMYENDWQL